MKKRLKNTSRLPSISPPSPDHLLILGARRLQPLLLLHRELYIGMMDEGICHSQGLVYAVPVPLSAQQPGATVVIHPNDNKLRPGVSHRRHTSPGRPGQHQKGESGENVSGHYDSLKFSFYTPCIKLLCRGP